jgi:hypothetical protein
MPRARARQPLPRVEKPACVRKRFATDLPLFRSGFFAGFVTPLLQHDDALDFLAFFG